MQQPSVKVLQEGGLWVAKAGVGEQPEQEQKPQQRQWRVGPFRSHEAAAEAAQLLRRKLGCGGGGGSGPPTHQPGASTAEAAGFGYEDGYTLADEEEDLQHCSLADLVQLLQVYVVDPGGAAESGTAAVEPAGGSGSRAGGTSRSSLFAAAELEPAPSAQAAAVAAAQDTAGDELLARRLQQEEEEAAAGVRRSSRRRRQVAVQAAPSDVTVMGTSTSTGTSTAGTDVHSTLSLLSPSAGLADSEQAVGRAASHSSLPPNIHVRKTSGLRYEARVAMAEAGEGRSQKASFCCCKTVGEAVAMRDVAVLWRSKKSLQPARASRSVVRQALARYGADTELVQQIEGLAKLKELQALAKQLRNSGRLKQLAEGQPEQPAQQEDAATEAAADAGPSNVAHGAGCASGPAKRPRLSPGDSSAANEVTAADVPAAPSATAHTQPELGGEQQAHQAVPNQRWQKRHERGGERCQQEQQTIDAMFEESSAEEEEAGS